jgi:DNA-binding IclR family transcriptional regulator
MPARHHRTVDRITAIMEEVAANDDGINLQKLSSVVGAPKSTVQGFVNGLLATGYLVENQHKYFLGPGPYILTLRANRLPARTMRHDDLEELGKETGLDVLLGVRMGEHVVYIDEVGEDPVLRFIAKSRARRPLLETASGKIMLADMPENELHHFLRNHPNQEAVSAFLPELPAIQATGIARNPHSPIAGGSAIATRLEDGRGNLLAAVTLIGPEDEVRPRFDELEAILVAAKHRWAQR